MVEAVVAAHDAGIPEVVAGLAVGDGGGEGGGEEAGEVEVPRRERGSGLGVEGERGHGEAKEEKQGKTGQHGGAVDYS